MKAAGLAAKTVQRGSCTCLFSNRAGLSEFTKPDGPRRLEQLAAAAIRTANLAGRAKRLPCLQRLHVARCASPSGPRTLCTNESPSFPFPLPNLELAPAYLNEPFGEDVISTHLVPRQSPSLVGSVEEPETSGFSRAHPLSLPRSRPECLLGLPFSLPPSCMLPLSPYSFSPLVSLPLSGCAAASMVP